MPELIEQMYCSQQIVIPPKYPYILKRFCKAAIKTQPYDLLRWSFEYFRALAEHRPPPVKLRLEYPIYSTEGGLTRGCLKVLGHQLFGMTEIPLKILSRAWQGFCLDPVELKRILCLCEVYQRQESVPYSHFIAVAGGMLTKCLTHTMILLCETLTKEPDGGSAAIPLQDFLTMYKFLAEMDASKDVNYHNGYREGEMQSVEGTAEEEDEMQESEKGDTEKVQNIESEDEYWEDDDLQKLQLIDDHFGRSAKLSTKMNMPTIGKIERSPSIERIAEIERENYMLERKGKPQPSEEIDKQLRQMTTSRLQMDGASAAQETKEEKPVEKKEMIEIFVYDENEEPVAYEFYGEPKEDMWSEVPNPDVAAAKVSEGEETPHVITDAEKVEMFLEKVSMYREERLLELEQTFDDIANLVDKFNTANYDLGMVAGRQMSTTSGEFIVQHIEKEIMAYIDEQIAILPDPDLKKKKAKPEEVAMVRDILEQFLDDNMDIIVPEIEEVEEEEVPIPVIVRVYAVPGIGPPVDPDMIAEFEDYCLEVSKVQADLIMPRNIRHFLCPPLEKYIEHNYAELENQEIKEEIATGGTITE